MIIEKVIEYKRNKIRQYPVHANRASEAGHPCLKYLVLNRTRWQEKTLHDVGMQFVFDEGHIQEEAVMRDLAAAGVQVVEQQRPFTWEKFQLTGHIDGKVESNGKLIPLEIKSMSPFVFKTVNAAEDLLKSRYSHLKKYPAQLQLYMIMDSTEEALLILKDKSTGQLKEIPFTLDYEYCESILKRLEAVNNHTALRTAPDQEWDDSLCTGCGFLHLCHPDRNGSELKFILDPELESKLDRRAALKPLADEYKALDEDIKDALREKDRLAIGNWLVTGKWVERKPYTVNGGKYWLPTIKRIQ